MLKVGHHGSNTSTDQDFIKEINAKYALISAGKDNRYGHPTTEVIETLESENLVIYRTDQEGAVQYIFKDNSGIFQSFLGHDQ
ncbi:ComEC/Rec2 family competence protein [Pseudogracilibacillus sp. SO30301A]|uniref:ComEC/Rec2 family competence protein n=1 Tax=Pseudogracilibacillus sp. SO30301A TaxID=3098291 RepID=UPI00300E42D6